MLQQLWFNQSHVPKAWLKPWLTKVQALSNQPGLPDITICAKGLVNQGTPGKPGNSKKQEN